MSAKIKAKHTLIDETSIMELLRHYELRAIEHCSFLTKGLNDTYMIKTKNHRYVFRVYRYNWRDKSAILFELDALNHLKEKNYPVSYPIRKKDGSILCEIEAPEGMRYGVLFSCAEGERPEVNADNAFLMGKALGKMHVLTDTFQTAQTRGFQLNTGYLLDRPASIISPVLNTYFDKDVVTSFHDTVENIKLEIEEKNLEIGFCHGDFHNRNMHIHNDRLEIFDFDCCGIGYRAYDIAVAWWNMITIYNKNEKACWDLFLQGYLSERDLRKDDFHVLPFLTTTRRIWLLGTMLENEAVWGRNWITKQALELFILQVKTDHLSGE